MIPRKPVAGVPGFAWRNEDMRKEPAVDKS
jgi:hypothetical protein